MRLRKCVEHGYTLWKKCDKCEKETKEAHYKFIKMKDVNEIFKRVLKNPKTL